MIPTAGSADLDDVYRELLKTGGQQDQLLGTACRPGNSAQVLSEHPRDQGQLLFAADRAHHRTLLAVELRGPQQVGIGVTDLGDAGAAGVDRGQQGTPLKRVVHHLPLQSHGDQSTSAVWRQVCDRPGCFYDQIVATGRTANTRAKDSDRNDTCQILDTALAEGQLSMAEHGHRVKAATNAATLGDLRGLVSDLQTGNAPVQLPDLTRRKLQVAGSKAGWGMRAAVGAVLVALGIGIGWGLYGNTSSPLSLTADPGAKHDGVAPVVLTPPRQLQSLGGLTGLLDQMRKKFGDTLGYRLVIYPEYAVLDRPDPADDRRNFNYYYRGGFGDPTPSARSGDARTVDLAKFDAKAIIGVLRGAPETLGIRKADDIKSTYLIIEPTRDPTNPEAVTISIYISSEFGSGYLQLAPDGTVKNISYP